MIEEKLKSLMRRTSDLAKLERGWNEYGAMPISKIAINKTLDILYSLRGLEDCTIEVFPVADGSVRIEIGVHGNKTTEEL
jgi:hypothetical protein